MTKIQLDQNAIIQAGIEQVNRRNFDNALGLFGKVDSYESWLNQLACLGLVGENYYAIDVYRRLVANYVCTHNVASDVARLGESIYAPLRVATKDYTFKTKYNSKKISADTSLLADYKQFDMDDLEDFFDTFTQELDLQDDFDIVDESQPSTPFFDVKSPSYPQQIAHAWDVAKAQNDNELAGKYEKMLLECNSTDTFVLQMQIECCINSNQYNRGCELAQILYAQPRLTAENVSVALKALFKKPSKYKQLITNFLVLGKKYVDEFEVNDLQSYAIYANNNIEDVTVAFAYAKALYQSLLCDFVSLKLCACVFINADKLALAKRILTRLRECLPFDPFAPLMLDYINNNKRSRARIKVPQSIVELFIKLPAVLQNYAHKHFLKADANNLEFTQGDYLHLSAIIDQAKLSGIMQDFPKYAKFTSASRVIVECFTPRDIDEFVYFVKNQLATMYGEPSLLGVYDNLLSKALQIGFRGKIVLRLRDGKGCIADFSKLTVTDKAFLDALCICKIIADVDVSEMQNHYLQLVQLGLSISTDLDKVRQLSYLLLLLTTKSAFYDKEYYQLFIDEDKALFDEYYKLTAQSDC